MSMRAVLTADISGFQSAMRQVETATQGVQRATEQVSRSANLKDVGKKFQDVGKSVTDVGKKFTLLTAPIAGAGIAAIKVGSDFQQSMANVSAISGATGDDFKKLEGLAREMGATTKFSASESADALGFMAMAGWNTQQMMDGLPGVLNLAAASGTNLATTSDIVTDAITAFGDKASDAGRYADVMAAASSSANTNVEMLGESFKYVAPVAGAMGYSLEDTSKALALMANNGIKASQGGTSLKNIMTNLANPTKAMKGAMDDLGISLTDSNGNMKSLDEVMLDLRNGFSGLSEEQAAQYAATLAGKEGMAGLLAIVGASDEDFNKLGDAINNSNGKAQEMADIMGDTVQGKLAQMKSALEEAGIAIFTALEPALRKVIEVVTQLATWFGNLSAPIQTAVVALGAVAVAIGPILVIAGTLISSIGTIITTVGTLSAALTAAGGVAGVFGTVLAALTGPVGLAVLAVAGLGVAVVAAVNHFSQDSIEPITRFGDDVSESTQKAVGAFFDMSEQADVALKEMAWGQQEVTQQMADDMITQQQAITDNLLSAIQERNAQETQTAQEQFANMSALSEEQKTAILGKITERFNAEAASTEEGNARIAEIMNTAASEKRALTQSESDEILKIREGMKESAVRVMSENEAEQKAILEKMKHNSGTLTALEAAEVVKNATKKKDDVIKEANDQFDKTTAWALRQRDELGTMSAAEADAVIKEAGKKRDEQVKAAEDTHKKVVTEAKNQAGEHVKQVDWSTGEIKSKWTVMKDDIYRKTGEIATSVAKGFQNAFNGAKDWVTQTASTVATKYNEIKTTITNKINEAKTNLTTAVQNMATSAGQWFGNIVTSASTKFNDVKTKITTPIETAKNTVKGIVDQIKGFFSGMSLSIPSIKLPKLPKFTLTGNFSLMPPSVPKIGVSWHAKGGIFDSPTLFATPGGMHGVGEAGPEAILPLNARTLGGIGQGIVDALNSKASDTQTDQPNVYNITFNIDKMNGNETDVRKISKMFMDELKRTKGFK